MSICLFQVFDNGQTVYLVQDLLRGNELLDRVLTVPNFTEREASDIICTLTKTVEYLHSQGVSEASQSLMLVFICQHLFFRDCLLMVGGVHII